VSAPGDDDAHSTASTSGSTTSTSSSSGGDGEGEGSGGSEPAAANHDVVYDGPPITVAEDGLREYVGLPPFASDRIYESATPPGVVVGLAWTAMGGATLYVEAASVSKVGWRWLF
jgi:Lon-like ATP-dependent protease